MLSKSFGAFAAGCLMATVSAQESYTEVAELICAPQNSNTDSFLQEGKLGAEVIDTLHTYMCSLTCPCDPEVAQIYGNLSDKEKSLLPFEKLVTSKTTRTFSTFQECWDQRLVTTDLFDSEFKDKMDAFLDSMDVMEDELSCSGICTPGLFWFTQPVTFDRPTDSCIMAMLDQAVGDDDLYDEELMTKL